MQKHWRVKSVTCEFLILLFYYSVLCNVGYLSDGGTLSHAWGVGGGVVGIVEGLLIRVHGNLILPIEPMVT